MLYCYGNRTGFFIILMVVVIEMTVGLLGTGTISQASAAEEVILTGSSCVVASGQEKKCKIAAGSPKPTHIVADLFSTQPTVVQLEQFRVLNENFRNKLEEDRKLSEQQRISTGALFTPAYLREMEAYQKGMKLYHIRVRTYQKRLEKLNKGQLGSVVVRKRKPSKPSNIKRGKKPRQRLVHQEIDRAFPYFPGVE